MPTPRHRQPPHLLQANYTQFLIFSNEYIHPSFTANYHRRYNDILRCKDHQTFVLHDQHIHFLDESFVTHHWNLVEVAKEHFNTPLCVYLNYVLDDSGVAQVLSYEIWIDQARLVKCMRDHGTFPFEVYVTQLLRRMISRCSGVQKLKTCNKITEDEYKFLLDACPSIPHWNTSLPLVKHQVSSFFWMYRVEEEGQKEKTNIVINPLCTPILNTGYFYNRQRDVITNSKPSKSTSVPYHGGILADITGSGKTAVVIALVLATLTSPPFHDNMMSLLDDRLYFRSNATLIVTPNNLPHQWINEIDKFTVDAPLNIVTILDMRDFRKVTLDQLLEADIVITTMTFLTSKRYMDEVYFHVKQLIQFPFVDYNASTFNTAWRIAVNKNKPGFEKDSCIPLESIKWKRMVIDEIHTFFTDHRKFSLPNIKSCFYWGLSGTPMAQHPHIFQQYVKYVSSSPLYWVPEFKKKFMEACFHRFDGLELVPVQKHLHMIDLSEREKQLLKCCQADLSPEKMVQLCSYFNLVDVNSMDQKIQLLNIEEIIKRVKRDKRKNIRDLESKIKHHEIAIRQVAKKISEAKEDIQELKELKKVKKTQESEGSEGNEGNEGREEIESKVKAEKDMLRSRKRRMDRMTHRKEQLQKEKEALDKSMGFFEDKMGQLSNQPFDNCPICMVDDANVITQCGHVFCRTCLIRCLQQNYVCPICKEGVTPKDAHEIRKDCPNLNKRGRNEEKKENGNDDDDDDNDEEKKDRDMILKNDRVERYGSKLTTFLDLLNNIIAKGEKVVICVQWTSLLCSIREILRENCIASEVILGNTACQNAAIRKFKGKHNYNTTKTNKINNKKGNCEQKHNNTNANANANATTNNTNNTTVTSAASTTSTTSTTAKTYNDSFVLMLSLENNSTGLDLVEANHLVFAHSLVGEEHIVKAMEEQAVARVRRTGQTKDVHVHWLITKKTIEERIYLQTRI